MIRTIDVLASDGVAASARVAGERGPALIFIHGVGSTAAIWDRQLQAFAVDARCAAIELRGNGVPKPEPQPDRITRDGYARDVLAVMDALGIERATIVGCSLGGVVAMELWSRAPQRIAAMVLLGTFAAYPNARHYAEGIKAAASAAGTMAVFAQERAAKLGLPPERLEETIAQMSVKALPSYLAATEATWTGDYRALLPSIDVPVLVCVGEADTVAPLELSREISQRIQSSMVYVIAGAGHVANADNPQEFNAALRRFISKGS